MNMPDNKSGSILFVPAFFQMFMLVINVSLLITDVITEARVVYFIKILLITFLSCFYIILVFFYNSVFQ